MSLNDRLAWIANTLERASKTLDEGAEAFYMPGPPIAANAHALSR